jgi:hypothetical protein
MARQCPLHLQGTKHRLLGACESDEKRIPLRAHLIAGLVGYGSADQAPVLGQNLGVALPERLDQPCRTFDIAEKERHRPARKPGHAAARRWSTDISPADWHATGVVPPAAIALPPTAPRLGGNA